MKTATKNNGAKWIKQGLVYAPSGRFGFDVSHCHKPTPLRINEDTVRVYFGVRDDENITRTTFVDLEAKDLRCVKYIHPSPVLEPGKIGAFDDCGANVSAVVRDEERIYMYYIGWNPSTTVHTRNSIGIAVSYDNGFSFNRLYDGPVLDRNKDEPYYTGAVDVMKIGNEWKMWYTSGSEWKIINCKPEIFYHIKYAHSNDGIDWQRDNILCIPPAYLTEVTARPCVIYDKGIYRMWYSRRNICGFRTNYTNSYRAGYAESDDGLSWIRKDKIVGIDISECRSDWDAQAIAYPYVMRINETIAMFYNGNGFGKTGFGIALLCD